MMKFSPLARARIEILSTILLVLAGAGIFIFMFIRTSSNIMEAKQTLVAIEAHTRALETYRKQSESVQELLESRASDIARIEALQVDSERPLNFIEQVENLAQKTGAAVTLDVRSSGKKTDAVSLTATLEGKEEQTRAMLKILTTLPYRIEVERIFYQHDPENKKIPIQITVPFTISPL